MRARLSSTGSTSSLGLAPDGEMEDYRITIRYLYDITVDLSIVGEQPLTTDDEVEIVVTLRSAGIYYPGEDVKVTFLDGLTSVTLGEPIVLPDGASLTTDTLFVPGYQGGDLTLRVRAKVGQIANDATLRMQVLAEFVDGQYDTNTFNNDKSTNFEVQVPRLDFGDAPAGYPVRLADDGARHAIVPGGPSLGAAPVAKPGGAGAAERRDSALTDRAVSR